MPTQNGVVTVGNNKTTPLRPDTLLGEFALTNGLRPNDFRAFRDVTNRE